MAKQEVQTRNLSKTEKAAVLMLCMDEKTTSELFNQMDDAEIRRIASTLLKIDSLPSSQVQDVLQEFAQGVKTAKEGDNLDASIKIDGNKITQNLLSKSLPADRSREILSTLTSNQQQVATENEDFQGLIKQYNTDDLFELLKNEHPQVSAIALANAKKKTAKEVISKFDEEKQIHIISRMAQLETISGQAMSDLQEYVVVKMREMTPAGGAKGKEVKQELNIEGMEDTIKLLKSFGRDAADKLISGIGGLNEELSAAISKRMFTIEDLLYANDVGIRELLRGITNEDLKIGLKDSDEAIKEKFFGNMSERAALILREDMEVIGALKVEEIEAAQQNILNVAKNLMKEDKLILETPADEEDDEE